MLLGTQYRGVLVLNAAPAISPCAPKATQPSQTTLLPPKQPTPQASREGRSVEGKQSWERGCYQDNHVLVFATANCWGSHSSNRDSQVRCAEQGLREPLQVVRAGSTPQTFYLLLITSFGRPWKQQTPHHATTSHTRHFTMMSPHAGPCTPHVCAHCTPMSAS
jgi:hypothetical protein